MVYYIDIDNTICRTDGADYETAQPVQKRIDRVNALYDSGHTVVLWTARGATTGRDWMVMTRQQLHEWGVRYHRLSMVKPEYDRIIDDKAENWGDIYDA